ncbi:MAG: hypothetical protein A3E21_01620 [Sulfurimonas sp. RIFCSPHIGHO2_12_FULL_36_9]|uniref:hypothetical protein n=1 Tax=Sulfurimonas sp. RIFCSPLOWO2_12_36_12 TaxID=1802253 RepID=UPI0008C909C5|nr:hypothetical protein [Sulfurimonas sp. RIFCSPLOWO2_12_36_12]OHD97868.1 MAG: hypothetical protein A3E21_01620 [Sulfurimonas sp. RIFCSPHIGHO2_12_FULL_36_9]OHD99255.1 MAG: hypothetical protein A3J26_04475 [Sulfurimonas sp. RIFCSPLOWO2_02_FULL_36_28]OHE03004.1 MAG: hypothetical protein A2W82_01425 [Sulfurimonas sp. RIFCSPLOWO2_12_36_12]
MQETDLSISKTEKPFFGFYSYMFIGIFASVMIGMPLVFKVSEYFIFIEIVTIVLFLVLALRKAFKKYDSIVKKVLASVWALIFSFFVILLAENNRNLVNNPFFAYI